MAGKSKYSVYNNANNPLDRTFDGSKSVPPAKKGRSEAATKKTFATKAGGQNGGGGSSKMKKNGKKSK
jgi:hypothetical protein